MTGLVQNMTGIVIYILGFFLKEGLKKTIESVIMIIAGRW